MSGDDPGPMGGERGLVRGVKISFGVTVLGAAGFAVAYGLGGNTQLLGLGLGVAFAGLAAGFFLWGRHLLPSGGFVEERPPLSAPTKQRQLLASSAGDPLHRRGLIGMLALAAASIGVAALFPLRSLLSFRRPDPVTLLRHTVWGSGGLRLVTPDGAPVRAADVTGENIQIVVPEGHTRDGDAPAFVVRLNGNLAAYSLLCTHAGCPVALYQQTTGHLLCPCHQSAFDLLAGAKPIAGPAARPLPGLPIEVDDQGYLRATGDFTGPPGAGFWSRS